MKNLRQTDQAPSDASNPSPSCCGTDVQGWSADGYPEGLPKCRSVRRAYQFAADRLAGKTRGQHNEAALLHSVRVAQVLSETFGVRSCRLLVTALLHDVLEDSDADYDEIAEEFGVQVADAVVLLTKPKFYPKQLRKEIYESALLIAHEEVLLIKLADLYENLQTRRGRKRVRRTWKTAQRLIDALSSRHLGPKVRRATRIVRDLLDELDREELGSSEAQTIRSEEMPKAA